MGMVHAILYGENRKDIEMSSFLRDRNISMIDDTADIKHSIIIHIGDIDSIERCIISHNKFDPIPHIFDGLNWHFHIAPFYVLPESKSIIDEILMDIDSFIFERHINRIINIPSYISFLDYFSGERNDVKKRKGTIFGYVKYGFFCLLFDKTEKTVFILNLQAMEMYEPLKIEEAMIILDRYECRYIKHSEFQSRDVHTSDISKFILSILFVG